MLHTAVFPVVSWCVGCRAWTQDQLRSVRTMQIVNTAMDREEGHRAEFRFEGVS